ncbi:hypothetical protein STIAU_6047 [Stigmatella aurantiaca DW4/3-1]|uniref:Uncharacterized protein n=1 Tax=Stigmatella aurantiaca (strain DW4/3-1) TaxID=378806 RepID=Q09A80_STIAD|nr:hypothetical protein STIAU_6047 [Stigmatella aurantiaca DW4/3-1]
MLGLPLAQQQQVERLGLAQQQHESQQQGQHGHPHRLPGSTAQAPQVPEGDGPELGIGGDVGEQADARPRPGVDGNARQQYPRRVRAARGHSQFVRQQRGAERAHEGRGRDGHPVQRPQVMGQHRVEDDGCHGPQRRARGCAQKPRLHDGVAEQGLQGRPTHRQQRAHEGAQQQPRQPDVQDDGLLDRFQLVAGLAPQGLQQGPQQGLGRHGDGTHGERRQRDPEQQDEQDPPRPSRARSQAPEPPADPRGHGARRSHRAPGCTGWNASASRVTACPIPGPSAMKWPSSSVTTRQFFRMASAGRRARPSTPPTVFTVLTGTRRMSGAASTTASAVSALWPSKPWMAFTPPDSRSSVSTAVCWPETMSAPAPRAWMASTLGRFPPSRGASREATRASSSSNAWERARPCSSRPIRRATSWSWCRVASTVGSLAKMTTSMPDWRSCSSTVGGPASFEAKSREAPSDSRPSAESTRW